MKTVENNLTYENLVKTDWIKQFNKDQQKQIVLGLEKGLDLGTQEELLDGYKCLKLEKV